jgi:uncharacterized protein (UPF0261 family)
MGSEPKVLMIMTLDTKEAEAGFIRKCLEESGVEVLLMDPSIRGGVSGGADITPDQIAAAEGKTMAEVRALNHEAKCLEVMTKGSIKCAHELHNRVGLSGIISAGGSMGTDLGAGVMRTFPVGLPKVMISTMASGNTRSIVGARDIVMIPSICDIAGLNAVTRRIFENGSRAVAGMAHGYKPAVASDKPLIAIGTLGTTESCCGIIRKSLEEKGCEVMVFHTQGVGGVSMDEIVREQNVSVAINLSLVEVVDYLCNGIYSGGPDRCKASLEKGVPTIFAPGNIDFMVGGPIDDAMARWPNHKYHIHNQICTAVRTGEAEEKMLADHMAGLIKDAKGPVVFFVPLLGFSAHDSEQGHLYEPSLPPIFAEYLKKVIPDGVPVVTLPNHINDRQFAEKIVEQAIAFMT